MGAVVGGPTPWGIPAGVDSALDANEVYARLESLADSPLLLVEGAPAHFSNGLPDIAVAMSPDSGTTDGARWSSILEAFFSCLQH